MSSYSSKDVHLFLDSYNLGTATTALAVGLVVDVLEVTNLQNIGMNFAAGQREDSLQWAGFFDDDNSWDDVLANLVGRDPRIFSIAIGSGYGSVAYSGSSLLVGARNPISLDALVLQELVVLPFGSIDRGQIHFPRGRVVNGMSNPNSGFDAGFNSAFGGNEFVEAFMVDNGTATLSGGVMYGHVLEMSGSLATGTVSLRFEHSSDGSHFVQINSLTQNFTSVGAMRTTSHGSLERYTRATYLPSTAGAADIFVVFKRN